MGRFQLESIYLYFPPSSQLVEAGTTVENKGKLILIGILSGRMTGKHLKIFSKSDIHYCACAHRHISQPRAASCAYVGTLNT